MFVILAGLSLLNCTFQGLLGGCFLATQKTESTCRMTCSPDGCRPTNCQPPSDEKDKKESLPTDDRCCSSICQCQFLVPEFQFEIGLPDEAPELDGPNSGQDIFEHPVWFSIWHPPPFRA